MINIIKGQDLFSSNDQTLVNPVNCKGVMGKGLALAFKLKYPKMFTEYKKACIEGTLSIGNPWMYRISNDKNILNFPTKDDWKRPTKPEYLEAGLDWFYKNYKDLGIESISFPLLGAGNGGLDPAVSLSIMEKYLAKCIIPISIYLP